MQIAPQSKEQWFDLVLLPAKVCLVALIIIMTTRLHFEVSPPGADKVLGACLFLSGPALLVGALFQSIFCRSGEALRTLLFIGTVWSITWSGIAGPLVVIGGWLMWRFIRSVERGRPIREEPIECVECQNVIPIGDSRCSHCGWTFAA